MLIDLRVARDRGEWTLQEVADASGVDKATIWRLENGRITNPGTDTVSKLETAVIDGKRLIRRGEHLAFGLQREALSA